MNFFGSNLTSYETFDDSSDDDYDDDFDDDGDDNSKQRGGGGGGNKRSNDTDGNSRAGEESSEDEFESEMKADLSRLMSDFEKVHSFRSTGSQKHPLDDGSDDDDDDDDDGDKEGGHGDDDGKSRGAAGEEEDDFYDPLSDDLDRQWVNAQRSQYRKRGNGETSGPASRGSDAVLNCALCMTTLCRDCQRHATYKSQYRAMFAFNCRVLYSQRRVTSETKGEVKRPKRRHGKEEEEEEEEEKIFHPVNCAVCDTEVGVFDEDEVYHFYNVLASY